MGLNESEGERFSGVWKAFCKEVQQKLGHELDRKGSERFCFSLCLLFVGHVTRKLWKQTLLMSQKRRILRGYWVAHTITGEGAVGKRSRLGAKFPGRTP